MKNTIIKGLFVIASCILLIAIGVIIGINIRTISRDPAFVSITDKTWTLGEGEEKARIEENYWNFIRASYILIGTPPDCEYYKIVSEVKRHDYDVENFYIDDNSDKMYYHNAEGERVSTLAIDVSAFQPEIDWTAVKAAGVDVAMIRVGYRGYGSGKIVEDDMFRTHIQGALDAGLRVGVYFFSQALNYDEGVSEANFVLETIREFDVTCPVVIDTEFMDASDARTNELDIDSRTDSIVGFCETVEAAGYTAMIYSNRNWFVQSVDMSRLGDYKLWLAHYTNQPDFPYEYIGWQYTDQGTLDGVDGSVDLNVWFK
ncbi:MAG: Lyzozyme M1 (1,4-beta-N-acetylmuramidase) [Lachnospiraceae bacterium]|nr:Lyzozyme M1 (1,4-beta-N-acetylmuramidase) [Lachnospiraceae bacterium]